MTDNIWTSYAERRPTKEDADLFGHVVTRTHDGRIENALYTYRGYDPPLEHWCRTSDLDRATGYVKPRKLHPAWRELRADSWRRAATVWVFRVDERPVCLTIAAFNAFDAGYTHWQPCDPPPVWEDE